MSESRSSKLDLVLDNPELRFPPDGPNFKFIFWAHTPENLPPVLPLLEDCDVIATECAYFYDDNGNPAGESIWLDYSEMNDIMAETASAGVIDVFRHAAGEGDNSAAIALHFEGSGKIMVPIDTFATMSKEQYEEIGGWYPGFKLFLDGRSDYAEAIRRSLRKSTACLRRRENTSLRQLHDIATTPGDDGFTPQTIGVLYGACHTPLYVAMSRLGARTQRHFVDPLHKTFEPFEFLVRQIRYGLKTPEEITDKEIQAACLLEMAWLAIPAATDSLGTQRDSYRQEEQLIKVMMNRYKTDEEECMHLLNKLHSSLNSRRFFRSLRMRQAAWKVLQFAGNTD